MRTIAARRPHLAHADTPPGIGEVFARVRTDRRHMEVKVLHSGLTDKRRFAAWSMCGRQLSEADDAIVTLLETHKRFDPGTLSEAAALSLLSIVSDIKSRKAPSVDI